jgi:hypothetical protein
MSNEIHTYSPPTWIRVTVGVFFLVFVVMLVIAVVTGLKTVYVLLSIAATVLALLAVIESIIARVRIEPSAVVIKGLFKTERVSFAIIENVTADGGRVALYLGSKEWKRLPDWLGANMSARRRIADRIGR